MFPLEIQEIIGADYFFNSKFYSIDINPNGYLFGRYFIKNKEEDYYDKDAVMPGQIITADDVKRISKIIENSEGLKLESSNDLLIKYVEPYIVVVTYNNFNEAPNLTFNYVNYDVLPWENIRYLLKKRIPFILNKDTLKTHDKDFKVVDSTIHEEDILHIIRFFYMISKINFTHSRSLVNMNNDHSIKLGHIDTIQLLNGDSIIAIYNEGTREIHYLSN